MSSAATSAPAPVAAPAAQPWLKPGQPPEARAEAAVAAMTLDEKLRLIFGYSDQAYTDLAKVPDDLVSPELKAYVISHQVKGSAGFVPGVPRLGIPDQAQTDASIGVRNSLIPSTALPSSLATAASWDPEVPRAGGAVIGAEARATGHNTMLSGGANLAREPRNGRNFEYTGEDPLLAGTMAGALIDGIQSNHIVSTMKHYAVNDQETLRTSLDATISAEAMRQSDLLAFEFALERGRPGSVMCSYNLINGRWGCENDYLLNTVLKQDWGFEGFVMSDWGAVHSTADAANDGLDQFTGFCCVGDKPWFAPPAFNATLQSGAIPERRLDDMATRIVWALFASGAVDNPIRTAPVDYAANAQVSQAAAEQSLVLLKNDGNLLPLGHVKSLAVIGGNADNGVIAGGGSSDVTPVGGAVMIDQHTYLPSPPLAALQHELPRAQIAFDPGANPASAAALASKSDVAIVFVTQHDSEGSDGSLTLTANQDALVSAVAQANPRTVVVIESGGAVFMPWLAQVPAVLEAFYPGIRGGAAIARILTGKVNPSGHLPISFPASPDQFAHPAIAGAGLPDGTPAHVTYDEGAAIGYKWYDLKGYRPLFAFGHGLAYTSFAASGLTATADGRSLAARFAIRNTGRRRGKAVSQLYVAPADWQAAGWEAPKRLGAFTKTELKPGQSRIVTLVVDPRLLATYEAANDRWHIRAGTYRLLLGDASDAQMQTAEVRLPDSIWSARHPSFRPSTKSPAQ
ncbi:glycoside hydrolase family 3 protein [Sphingomonas sp.]|uniref:glycoside hydrolase family 3 protein n=1 Tax=Sphingomonas sp. TaxID=28214 RepID=UPI0025F493CB|nr:glycoside hydrolase family 3 protein [Sphingomonas sp.]